MGRIIGIDLGTTNSLCAVIENDGPTLVPNALGEYLTPSVVGVLDNGQVVVGQAAQELRVTRPLDCAWCFKRWMGTNRKATLRGQDFSATELSSLVLRSLKQDARAYLGQKVTEAVITVPAYFNDDQRQATHLAGRLAIRETHFDFSTLLEELTDIEDERITYNRMIGECLQRDFGLGVFSELQQFLK